MRQYENIKYLVFVAISFAFLLLHIQYLRHTIWNIPGIVLIAIMYLAMVWFGITGGEERQFKKLIKTIAKESSCEVVFKDDRMCGFALNGISLYLSLKKPKNNWIDNATNSIVLYFNTLNPEIDASTGDNKKIVSELKKGIKKIFNSEKGVLLSADLSRYSMKFTVEIPCHLSSINSMLSLITTIDNIIIKEHGLNTLKAFCKETDDEGVTTWWAQEGENITHSIVHIPDQDYWGLEAAYDINLFTDDSQAELISRDEYLAVCDKAYEHLRKDIMS